jgi:hypothetical protein
MLLMNMKGDTLSINQKHSPAATVRLCFASLLLHKEQDCIHMPRGFMDDLEGEVIDEELYECALGEDIFSTDPDGEDALLPNIRGILHNCSKDISLFVRHHTP